MNKLEYWLLKSVVYGRAPLHILDERNDKDNVECWYGSLPPQSTHNEVVNTFYSLFCKGDLQVQHFDDEWNPVGPLFSPTLQEVKDGLAGKVFLKYGLTEQGGAKWERVTNPNWSLLLRGGLTDNIRNFDDALGDKKGDFLMICAIERSLVEEQVEKNRSQGQIPLKGKMIWSSLIPWEVTYWKTLPSGWRLIYQYYQRRIKMTAEAFYQQQESSRTRTSWYTIPKLED